MDFLAGLFQAFIKVLTTKSTLNKKSRHGNCKPITDDILCRRDACCRSNKHIGKILTKSIYKIDSKFQMNRNIFYSLNSPFRELMENTFLFVIIYPIWLTKTK